jgi:hypothetical protein
MYESQHCLSFSRPVRAGHRACMHSVIAFTRHYHHYLQSPAVAPWRKQLIPCHSGCGVATCMVSLYARAPSSVKSDSRGGSLPPEPHRWCVAAGATLLAWEPYAKLVASQSPGVSCSSPQACSKYGVFDCTNAGRVTYMYDPLPHCQQFPFSSGTWPGLQPGGLSTKYKVPWYPKYPCCRGPTKCT